ncbi:MAG: biotin/lipoyl-containing protein, partial [Planctomycetaceae bacterium]
MAIEFKLPEVSEGVKTADVSDILVAEGDTIKAGQVVMEVETEKAVAPVECPHAGRVAKIHVAQGDSLEIGATLLTIEETSDKANDKASEKASDKASGGRQPSEPKVAAPKSGDPAERAGGEEPFGDFPDPDDPRRENGGKRTASVGTATATQRSSHGGDGRDRPPVPAAPSVRRLARELGVDLYQVQGSGRGGRITFDDVNAFAEGGAPTGTGIAAPGGQRGGALAPS